MSARRGAEALLASAAVLLGACGRGSGPVGPSLSLAGPVARVGREGVALVHRFENHSSALVAWRRAGVRDRIVLHVDGHSDFDWLPDGAVARIAGTSADGLRELELHPYDASPDTVRKFGIWNFLYPAARLGIVREIVWVVPDGTAEAREGLSALLRAMLFDKIHMVSVEEAQSFRIEGGRAHGRLLGVPITICRLADLPAVREPVLLDVDLDFFTTRSAATLQVLESPWTTPSALVRSLGERGVATDLATLSMSTTGGFMPPQCRWLGRAMEDALREPGASPGDEADRLEADSARARGDLGRAEQIYRKLAEGGASDGSAWYGLARLLEATGRIEDARRARARAVQLDPLLEHAELFEADRLWFARDFEGAVRGYRRYLAQMPGSPYAGYALRRTAGVLALLGRTAEAVEVYRQALAVAPDHADTRMNLGLALLDAGDLAGAVEQLRAARRIEPEWGTYAMALGSALMRAGRLDEGLAEVSFAVSRRPTWAQARVQLAAGLVLAGRSGPAVEHARLAAWLEPESPLVRSLVSELRRRGLWSGMGPPR